MDLLPSARGVQKYLSRHLPEAITSRVRCLANEDRRIGEVSWEAVAAADFAASYEDRLRSNRLSIEFKAVEKFDPVFPREIASLPANEGKNAHTALPYDHNRIILRSAQTSHEDYINASLIEGYDDQTYIAAQGPIAGTVNDFWQMVWQQGAEVIVMLTDLFSYSKQQCEKYWHNTYNLYGDVHVRQDFVIDTCHYTFRRFHISKVGQQERAVDHWLFHHWDEYGLPDVHAMLELMRKVKTCTTSKHLPVIIHCSDGSGRTGTFIALDMVLDRLFSEGLVDVINTVRFLRTFRQKMVASAIQYTFIYKAVSMHLKCGVTVISVSRLITEAMTSSSGETKALTNHYEKEFETLTRIVQKIKVSDCAAGHRAENHSKSRDIMIQPPERARPYLMTFDSTDNSDYFNAVYVNGHRRRDEFIVTQWPLRCTVNDYWRLVYDCHISTVVVLHDESTSQVYPLFWPVDRGTKQRFGPIASTFIGSETRDGLVVKSFLIKKAVVNPGDVMAYGSETKQVKIIFLSKGAWPDAQATPTPLTPSSRASVGVASRSGLLVELLLAARACSPQSSSGGGGQSSSVLVISRDGVSRAGIYCTASIIYERLLDEDEADVFGAVRSVKENRPQLVGSSVEYNYCYAVATDLAQAYAATVRDMTSSSSNSTSHGNVSHEDQCTECQASSQSLTASSGHVAKGQPPLCVEEDDCISRTDDGQDHRTSLPITSSITEAEACHPHSLEVGGCKHYDDNRMPQASSRSRADTEQAGIALGNDSSLAASQQRQPQNSQLSQAHTTAGLISIGDSLKVHAHGLLQEQNAANQQSLLAYTRSEDHDGSENRHVAQISDADVHSNGSCAHATDIGIVSSQDVNGSADVSINVHSNERQNGHFRYQQKDCEKDSFSQQPEIGLPSAH